MKSILLFFCFIFAAQALKYNTHASRKADATINVHVVCHTHDDTGWLKTVDQYYVGLNNSIQRAAVALILDTVVPQLQKNPDRKFIYVEQAFFQRWWREQSSDMQNAVKTLVSSKQLVFINGGYCMHDEAAVHYLDMIDQTSVGHQFIANEFGVNALPTVGWQIDPFGHSATHAALISAGLFDSLFLGRIDFEDRYKRIAEKNLEFIWRASASYGSASDIWTSVDHHGNYNPPNGLCFDIGCSDEPIQDDPNLEDYNVQRVVDNFVAAAELEAQGVQGNDVIFKMGSDFQYRSARAWYKNLDKVIHYVNLDGRVNAFYSTPEIYAQAKKSLSVNWTIKTDDFFPYADVPHGYWTGYFTSRAALKRFVRESSAFLQTSRQLDLLNAGNGSSLNRYTEEQGLLQHHDAVSGTEKQHVAYDYAKRLSEGMADGEQVVAAGLAKLLKDSSLNLTQCRLINQSVCQITANNQNFAIIIYNQQARTRIEAIRVPVNSANLQVWDSTGANKVPTQIEPVAANPIPQDPSNPPAAYQLYFIASLPALGHTTYFVTPSTEDNLSSKVAEKAPDAPITLDNNYLRVVFESTTGELNSITNKPSGLTTDITQSFYWYQSYATGLEQHSGAYIFRPQEEKAVPINARPTITSYDGGVFQSVTQSWANWLNQTVRLYNSANYLEFEWTVGPVPIDDGLGKEIITRFTSDVASGDMFYTDANGREMQQRILNYRPTWNLTVTEPISGNYYPINSAIFIKDVSRQLTLVTDRSEGGSSLASGQLELMIHRRILKDDSRGVGEPMNETAGITPYPNPERLGPGIVVRGKHRLSFEPLSNAAASWRPLAQSVFQEPDLAFTPISTSPTTWASSHTTKSSGSVDLPTNVDVITLMAQAPGAGILRLAHEFGIGEDATLSKPVTVDLSKLFTSINLSSVTEYTLTGTQPKSLSKNSRPRNDFGKIAVSAPPGNITLNPLEIKTFQITFSLS